MKRFQFSVRLVMAVSLFSILSLSLLSSQVYAEGETDKYQIETGSEFFMAGSFNAEDELFAVVQLKYFLTHSTSYHPFFSAGYLTDLENEGSAIDIFNIDAGSQIDLFTFWSSRSYIEYGVGLTYIHEELSTQLIDRTATNSFGEFGYKGSFGWGFDFRNSFGTKIYISYYDSPKMTPSRTAGISFTYSF